jgi:hypothetical protein
MSSSNSDTISVDPRIKTANLSPSLAEMNDTADMVKKSPSCDEDSITKEIISKVPELQFCYMKRLRDKPDLIGKVTVGLKIDSLGNVVDCKIVESKLNDGLLENDILLHIYKWHFNKNNQLNDTCEYVTQLFFQNNLNISLQIHKN